MKYEFWVNVNRASMTATALAANKLLISVAHIILVNANEWSKDTNGLISNPPFISEYKSS